MRVYVEAYGCSLNRGESREMLEAAEERGHRIVASVEEAEVLLLDTCTVIQTTENRMLDRLRLMARTGKPVVVAGCMASAQPARVRVACPGAVLLPPDRRRELPRVLEELRALTRERGGARAPGNGGGEAGAAAPSTGHAERAERAERAGGAERAEMPDRAESGHVPYGPGPGEAVRAELPIASGCTGRCTYCITRLARGPLRSRQPEEILERAGALVSRGCRELRLCAQDSAVYGLDIGTSLPDLLSRLSEMGGDFRVRVGMMNPGSALRILPALLHAMRDGRFFRFLHVPVQSGDDGVLGAMGRGHTVEDFITVVRRFREAFPLGLLATDVIAGFPGEGGEEFARTLSLLEKTRPDIINIKAYSPRPGTEASRLRGGAPPEEVRRRLARLRELHMRISLENNQRLVGRVEEVLVTERGRSGGSLGRTEGYYPVIIPGGPAPGTFCMIRVTGARAGYLTGEAMGG